MAGFLYRGILLQQHKEPALSRNLREFLSADKISVLMDRAPVTNPDALTPEEIVQIARDARIIDERDGHALADKLDYHGLPPRLLVADAIDDEPYISSQLNPLLKNQQLAADGLRFAQRAARAEDVEFAVYKNLTDLEIHIPKKIADFRVRRIRGRYPADRRASQAYAANQDVLVVGVCALLHLARAILYNKPQTTAFITVAGDCIGNPINLEASLGITVGQALERCGLIDDPARVIIGGSMTGISVIDTDKTLVTPTTRAILAFRRNPKALDFTCIGCSRCVHVCPQGLNPFYLFRSIQRRRYDMFRSLDAQMCIGCGTCSYMCPAKLDLSDTIMRAKRQLRPMLLSINNAEQKVLARDEADFESYMSDWRLQGAQRVYLRTQKQLARELAQQEAAALRERDAALATAKSEMEAADQAHQQELAAADKELEQALADGQHSYSLAEEKGEKALEQGRQLIEQAQQAADQVAQEGEQAIAAAQAQADQVARDGERQLEEARRQGQQLEKEAQRQTTGAQKDAQQLQKDGERQIADAQKAVDAVRKDGEKLLRDAENNVARVRKDGEKRISEANRALTRTQEKLLRAEQDGGKSTPEQLEELRQAVALAGQQQRQAAQWLQDEEKRAQQEVLQVQQQAALLVHQAENQVAAARQQAATLAQQGQAGIAQSQAQEDATAKETQKQLALLALQIQKNHQQAFEAVKQTRLQQSLLHRKALDALEAEKAHFAQTKQALEVALAQCKEKITGYLQQEQRSCRQRKAQADAAHVQEQQRYERRQQEIAAEYNQKLAQIRAEDSAAHLQADLVLAQAQRESQLARRAAQRANEALTGRSLAQQRAAHQKAMTGGSRK